MTTHQYSQQVRCTARFVQRLFFLLLFLLTGVEAASVINNSFAPALENVSELVGCRYSQQHWCISVPKIYLFQYVIALVLIAIGYPVSSVLSYSIYSKILGPFKQVFTPTTCILLTVTVACCITHNSLPLSTGGYDGSANCSRQFGPQPGAYLCKHPLPAHWPASHFCQC